MFDKKYKKVLELLDKKIEFTQQMFDLYLEKGSHTEGLTDQEIYNMAMLRNGNGWYVHMYLAKLEALCELKREINKEMGLL